MLLALGGDGRNGNREESAEKTERVGRETESAVKILEELLIFGYRKMPAISTWNRGRTGL